MEKWSTVTNAISHVIVLLCGEYLISIHLHNYDRFVYRIANNVLVNLCFVFCFLHCSLAGCNKQSANHVLCNKIPWLLVIEHTWIAIMFLHIMINMRECYMQRLNAHQIFVERIIIKTHYCDNDAKRIIYRQIYKHNNLDS